MIFDTVRRRLTNSLPHAAHPVRPTCNPNLLLARVITCLRPFPAATRVRFIEMGNNGVLLRTEDMPGMFVHGVDGVQASATIQNHATTE